MKLRAPAVPLVTVDPYFSIWSSYNTLPRNPTSHWTGARHGLTGWIECDDDRYVFMGMDSETPPMVQQSLDINALSTCYSFSCSKVWLDVIFTTPLLMDDLYILSRPVSYIKCKIRSADGLPHAVRIEVIADDEICLQYKGQSDTEYKELCAEGITGARVGNSVQRPLNCAGDDIRIDWGYLYLATNAPGAVVRPLTYRYRRSEEAGDGTLCHDISLSAAMHTETQPDALFVIAYDDIQPIEYFGQPLEAWWRSDGTTIRQAIDSAIAEYDTLFLRCESFSKALYAEASNAGGERYAELLSLAYRQVVAAHKLVSGPDKELLFISKECFSGGFAATVDVSYPSIPLFLLYNPELVNGMLRPIFRYANDPAWPFDYAPHDVGFYPKANGQTYGDGIDPSNQMPVEECGNMLLMTTAAALASGDLAFAREHWSFLQQWSDYLIKNGLDPDNQLCTDDFAGHLAHNCNLSVKAIMGIAGFSILNRLAGNFAQADTLLDKARQMAKNWIKMASNGDGTYRLAFDQPNTFSMKYNLIWDKAFGTHLFPADVLDSESRSYVERRCNRYGMPLDNRATYTKSDWLIWSAALLTEKEDFSSLAGLLWDAYNESRSRVQMTDWYDTCDAAQKSFQNRTVQGGLYMKLMLEKKIVRI